MSLYEFVKNPEHYVARERLLHLKSLYEIKLQAAIYEQQILTTEPEIDNNGYDFTISLHHYHVHLQNKATLSDAHVREWSIHPSLLQASFYDRDLAPIVDSTTIGGYGCGASGGVLLHVIDANEAKNDKLKVCYYYFDIFYAGAVAAGLLDCKNFTSDQAKKLLLKIRDGEIGDRISLPFSAFMQVQSPAAVIGFRFHIPSPTNYLSVVQAACKLAEEGKSIESFKFLWRGSISAWIVK